MMLEGALTSFLTHYITHIDKYGPRTILTSRIEYLIAPGNIIARG